MEPENPATAESPDPAGQRDLLERLRHAWLEQEPTIAPEMVSGETLEALEASFAAARVAVERVRVAIEREQQGFPAGAPGRGPRQYQHPLDKIRAGLRETVAR